MTTLWIDIEADAFGASRRHEYEMEIGPYQWTYFTRIDHCIADVEQVLKKLQSHAPDHKLMICLGHHSNFRYAVFPQYKSNRRGIRRAAGYKALRDWIQNNYETVVFPNVEADDVLGLMAEEGDLIYSPDKDLRTIHGLHISLAGEVTHVNELQANQMFYKQVLTGDTSDGYGGCPGIGANAKVFTSDEWLSCATDEQFWEFVQFHYWSAKKKLLDKYEVKNPLDHCLKMARLARILRPGEYDFENERPILWNGPG